MKKLVITIGGIVFLSFLNSSSAWSQINFQKTDYPVGDHPEYAASGDFDQDGDLDLAIGKWIDQNLTILFNDGQGHFTTSVDYPDVSGCNDVLAVDLEKDGDLDLITCHHYNSFSVSDSTISLFSNLGNGTFTGPTIIQVGSLGPISATSFDVDNDGDLDIITANYDGGDISILINQGSQNFDSLVHIPIGQLTAHVVSADFNKDGYKDLAVSSRTSNKISVLFNQGNGTFAPKVDYPSNIGPDFLGVQDLDQDNDLDLAVANFDASQVSIFKNKGDGSFDPAVYYNAGQRPISIAFPDLDKDGDPDLVVANYYESSFTYLENTGNGVFAFKFNQFSGEREISILAGDWNKDSWTDLAVTNTFSDNISVFLTIPSTYGLQVLAGLDEFGFRGGRVDVEFSVKNTGQVQDSFQITASDSLGWTVTPAVSGISLAPGAENLIMVRVDIPPVILEGTKDKITLTATSVSAPALTQSASLKVTALILCGDVNNDGRISLSDVIYTVNYIFKDGPAPCNPFMKED